MIYDDFLKKTWNYYSTLEDDFISTIRYVSISTQNYETYSVEYAKQLLSICSEVGVISNMLYSSSEMNGHYKYYRENGVINTRVYIKNYSLCLQPFLYLNETGKLLWWSAYNCIKHHRLQDDVFYLANQKNVIYSLSALYILMMEVFKTTNADLSLFPKSKIFRLDNEQMHYSYDENTGLVISKSDSFPHSINFSLIDINKGDKI